MKTKTKTLPVLFKNKSVLPPFGVAEGGFILRRLMDFLPLWGLGGLLLLGPGAYAQSTWQWGIRGGSATDNSSNGDSFEETVVDMATDPNGNLYIISTVGGDNLSVGGQTFAFHHAVDNDNFGAASDDHAGLIASFDCDGNYRWGKLISGTNDFVFNLETDTLGNVYVTGEVFPGRKDGFGDLYQAHFDADTTIPYSPNPKKYKKAHFLARYDTLGNFEQLIMPQADSITFPESSNYAYAPLDLVADPDGTQHWFWRLREKDSPVGNPYTPSIEGDTLTKGFYLFRYDPQGNYLGEVKLEMHTVQTYASLVNKIWINHDPVSGSYYLSGYNYLYHQAQLGHNCSLHIGGQLLDSPMFVAKFDSLGQSVWVKKGSDPYGNFWGRPQLDNQGNIYLSGVMVADFENSNPIVTFNGYTGQNQNSNLYSSFHVLFKINANGNLLWGVDANTDNGVGNSFTEINGNEIAYSGSHAGITWGNISFPPVPNSGYDTYVASFDKQTGAFIAMDSIGSDFGYSEYPSAIAAGPRGNVYVGGEFTSQMYIAGNTLQNTDGTFGTDFFVATFGQSNCNCVLPEAKFAFSGNNNGVVNFSYTGTSGYNELEWGFGNGTTTTTTTGNANQTYTVQGEYWVCVTAYNNCGYDTWCTLVEPFNLDVSPLSKSNFQVYPNPFQNLLFIGATEPLTYRLFSITGKELRSGELEKGRNSLQLSNLQSGFYMLVMENVRGQRQTVKLVKE